MRFPSLAVVLGFVGAAAMVTSCGDLFHDTNWETLCDQDARAPGCKAAASSSHASTGTGGTGGMGGAGGTATTNGGGGTGGDPCGPYCNLIVNACVTDSPQYDSVDSCLHLCKLLPHDDAAHSNNIPCRQGYADKLADHPGLCEEAGPGGGGKCGKVCDAYCAIMTSRCGLGIGMCPTECVAYDPSVAYNTSVQTGNSLACRLYWAVEAVDDPTKCANAAKESPKCVDGDD